MNSQNVSYCYSGHNLMDDKRHARFWYTNDHARYTITQDTRTITTLLKYSDTRTITKKIHMKDSTPFKPQNQKYFFFKIRKKENTLI